MSTARCLAIFTVIYIHVPPWADVSDQAVEGFRSFDLIRLFLVEAIGRNSTSLLSVLSGFLLVRSLRKHGYPGLLRSKLWVLLVPLVLWNLITLGTRLGVAAVTGHDPSLDIRSPLDLADALVALRDHPLMVPTWFLRDMLVCVLLSPLLMAAIRRFGWFAIAALLVVSFADLDGLLLINDSMAMFFGIGLMWGMGLTDPPRWRVPMAVTIPVLLGAAAFSVWLFWSGNAGAPPSWSDPRVRLIVLVERSAGALALWQVATLLAGTPLARRLTGFEPYVFFVFCSHQTVLSVLWKLWSPFGGDDHGAAYPVFFFLSPFVCCALTIVVVRVLSPVFPRLFGLLSGGRVQVAVRGGAGAATPRTVVAGPTGSPGAGEDIALATPGRGGPSFRLEGSTGR